MVSITKMRRSHDRPIFIIEINSLYLENNLSIEAGPGASIHLGARRLTAKSREVSKPRVWIL